MTRLFDTFDLSILTKFSIIFKFNLLAFYRLEIYVKILFFWLLFPFLHLIDIFLVFFKLQLPIFLYHPFELTTSILGWNVSTFHNSLLHSQTKSFAKLVCLPFLRIAANIIPIMYLFHAVKNCNFYRLFACLRLSFHKRK